VVEEAGKVARQVLLRALAYAFVRRGAVIPTAETNPWNLIRIIPA
jgi:hypothetical protein